VRNYLGLIWGIKPYFGKQVHHTDELVEMVDQQISMMSLAAPGEKVVIIAGVPPGIPGTTNGMRVHIVGSGSGGRAEEAEVAEQV
jgi:pyruvate kinase